MLFRVVEAAPDASKVERVRFENPPSGAVFVEQDLLPREKSSPSPVPRPPSATKSTKDASLINERPLRFRCDCLAHVNLWMALPDGGAWLSRAALQEIAEQAAMDHGVTFVDL